jgi:nanoRNase/pAp phosphatase (c-di-AMP/oligoRNAs hydrolase)
MKKYGGGGHAGAGACQTDNDRADETLQNLIKEMRYGLFENLFQGYFNYY